MRKLPILSFKWGITFSCIIFFSLISCSTYNNKSQIATTSVFPWPPPPASAQVDFVPYAFVEAQTLMYVDSILVKALDNGGYSDRTYFNIPFSGKNGFVLVTGMEQTNEDATPKEEVERWNTKIKSDNFSFGDNFKTDFSSTKKYYRAMAFVVTKLPLKQSNEMIDKETVVSTLIPGATKLLDSIGKIHNTADFSVTSLIYEYEQEANSDTAELKKTSNYDGRTVLNRANILFNIELIIVGSAHVNVPEFPWPPPRASAKYVLPTSEFSTAKNLDDVNQKLSRALDANGYSDKSYFSAPSTAGNGFVLVTQLEQINEDATSKDKSERWITDIKSDAFSFGDYFKSLFLTKKGYFRVIAFVVTDLPFAQSNKMADKTTALSWLSTGTNELPEYLGQVSYTPKYKVTALIYEYEQEENSDTAKLEEPSKFTGKVHLEVSKIWKEITKQ